MFEYIRNIKSMSFEYVIFDLETTGLYFEYFDEPIEIGAVKLDENFDIIDRLHLYIMPKKKISEEIEAITGLNEEIIRNKGYVSTKNAVKRLRDFIGDAIPVGHNSTFDINFINYWLYKYNLPILRTYICTEKTYRHNYKEMFAPPEGRFKTNLTVMCESFGITNEQAHSAICDTEATAKCFRHMVEDEAKIAISYRTEKEAYLDFMKRIFNSRPYKNIVIDLTTIEPVKINKNYTELNKNKIIPFLKEGKNVREILSENTGVPHSDILGIFIDWINLARYKKINGSMWISKRSKFVAKDLLKINNYNIDDTVGFLKELTAMPIDTFKLELILKLECNIDEEKVVKAEMCDLNEYFLSFQPIETIMKEFELERFTVINYLAEWLKNNRNYIDMWIKDLVPKYLLTREEYRRMVAYKEKNIEKYNKWYSELTQEKLDKIENTLIFKNAGIYLN